MSMHTNPLTYMEKRGLHAHGLPTDEPSQLSDAFRAGVAWAGHEVQSLKNELEAKVRQNAQLMRERDAYRNAEETQIALRERVQEELNASLEREALKQAEVLDRLTELLKETHLDKAPNTARACMHVNDAINRVKQEVKPIRLSCRAEGHQ